MTGGADTDNICISVYLYICIMREVLKNTRGKVKEFAPKLEPLGQPWCFLHLLRQVGLKPQLHLIYLSQVEVLKFSLGHHGHSVDRLRLSCQMRDVM
jgi:hypothetical protein